MNSFMAASRRSCGSPDLLRWREGFFLDEAPGLGRCGWLPRGMGLSLPRSGSKPTPPALAAASRPLDHRGSPNPALCQKLLTLTRKAQCTK